MDERGVQDAAGDADIARQPVLRIQNRHMKLLRVAMLLLVLPVALTGCKLKDDTSIPTPPDVAAPPANAVKTASGIAYKVITVGLGSIHPSPRNQVRVPTGSRPESESGSHG